MTQRGRNRENEEGREDGMRDGVGECRGERGRRGGKRKEGGREGGGRERGRKEGRSIKLKKKYSDIKIKSDTSPDNDSRSKIKVFVNNSQQF